LTFHIYSPVNFKIIEKIPSTIYFLLSDFMSFSINYFTEIVIIKGKDNNFSIKMDKMIFN